MLTNIFRRLLLQDRQVFMKNKELRDILPENNENISLVPQILANNADGFINAAGSNEGTWL